MEETSVCPIEHTLDMIGGKWKLLILYYLMADGVKRYGELKRAINGITHKMLSQQLKDLEADRIILRKEYHQIPPKVEYMLGEKGATLLPILKLMYDWGSEDLKSRGITVHGKLDCRDRQDDASVCSIARRTGEIALPDEALKERGG